MTRKQVHILALVLLLSCAAVALVAVAIHRDRPREAMADRMNELSYAWHYRSLDSTMAYAERAYAMADGYDDGRAEALNNMAYVDIMRMNYRRADSCLKEVMHTTDNQIEQLIADIQMMRLCQRKSHNREFYDYREHAKSRMKRIGENEQSLSPHFKARMVYARSEYAIVSSTYFYYVGLTDQAAKALLEIDPDELEQDTAQYLNYLYNIGAGGILTQGSAEEVAQQEFDYLFRCYMMAGMGNYHYWLANSMEAISEHLQEPKPGALLMRNNRQAMVYLNVDNVADSLLAGNLAYYALDLFQKFGDVYQIAGGYRTLAQCYWQIGDYHSALENLNLSLSNKAIFQAPDLVASIREQLCLTYSALGNKRESDRNRTLYLDLQEQTRQDRQLEARAEQLDKASWQMNLLLAALIVVLIIVGGMLWMFYQRNRHRDISGTMARLLAPLEEWQQRNQKMASEVRESYDELQDDILSMRLRTEQSRKYYLEERARISLAMSVMPFIDRMRHEVTKLLAANENEAIRQQRYEYIIQLTDSINRYNDVLTGWIKLQQGSLNLHIESFALQDLFSIVAKGDMSFRQKGITLSVEKTDAVVKADRTLTLFMINTMADNARKFTPYGGRVVIEAMEGDDYVEVGITDTGRGMTDEEKAHVFDNKPIIDSQAMGGDASQADNKVAATPSAEHHGFGLLNCKGIIEKYKKTSSLFAVSSIGVESRVGQGSRFFFRLPKGIVRRALVIIICLAAALPSMALTHISMQSPDSPLLRQAALFADSAYRCNQHSSYDSTFMYARRGLRLINEFYRTTNRSKKDTLVVYDETRRGAELDWFERHVPMNYAVILDLRNEMAVAALAMNRWNWYQYNNKVYTSLFRQCSADNTLDDYVRMSQRTANNKNIALTLLVLLVLMLIPAWYLLYYRHKLFFEFCVDRVRSINGILLDSTLGDKEKYDRISHIWNEEFGHQQDSHLNDLQQVVERILEALRQSIDAATLASDKMETARDELSRASYEEARLHVANNVIDNCLSSLKHETMYYPSRIRQLVDGTDNNIQGIGELLDYYKALYSILCAQALRQASAVPLRADSNNAAYLMELLERINSQKPLQKKLLPPKDGYQAMEVTLTSYHVDSQTLHRLFTPLTPDLRFLICRQIVRDYGEALNARACGIEPLECNENETRIQITLTERIWKNLKL